MLHVKFMPGSLKGASCMPRRLQCGAPLAPVLRLSLAPECYDKIPGLGGSCEVLT